MEKGREDKPTDKDKEFGCRKSLCKIFLKNPQENNERETPFGGKSRSDKPMMKRKKSDETINFIII
jgi:hypothetical protein